MITITTPAPALLSHYHMGVDLGQTQAYTAIAVLEHVWGRLVFRHPGDTGQIERLSSADMGYNLVHLERLPLLTSYPAIAEYVQRKLQAIQLEPGCARTLLVDATGVGRPVVDMLRQLGLRPRPVTITGGNQVIAQGGGWHVPKRDLVGALQLLMQQRKLKVAEGLPDGRTLVQELQNFRYKISTSGHDTYEAWREGVHDDLVLAVAIACWYAHRMSKRGGWA